MVLLVLKLKLKNIFFPSYGPLPKRSNQMTLRPEIICMNAMAHHPPHIKKPKPWPQQKLNVTASETDFSHHPIY